MLDQRSQDPKHEAGRSLAKGKLKDLRPFLFFVAAAVSGIFLCCGQAFAEGAPAKTHKVLYIMSYHSPWEWTDDQLRGFKDGLKGLEVEYKVFQLDAKRQSAESSLERAGKEARDLIESWKPDLVYTSDDSAQKYVTRHYINSPIPFVFSAVNADPAVYGFTGSKNITGVLEVAHSVETIRLLREIVPEVARIGVVFDEDPTWPGVVSKLKEQAAKQLPGMELIMLGPLKTFAEYKQAIAGAQGNCDALALLGIHTLEDESGRNVAWEDVLKWTAENSKLPDFSFWKDRIPYGTLCVVYVSGYEQGLSAGRIARGILADGRAPASYAIEPTVKGKPIISFARAKKLGLKIKSTTLLSSEVADKFAWDPQ